MDDKGLTLDSHYWEKRYQNNQTGWDAKAITTPVKRIIDEYINDNQLDISILVPGCGYGYEAKYLLDNGFINVTIIDYSPTAIYGFKQLINKPLLSSWNVIIDNFFNLEGQFDLIIEQTFFCALDRNLRNAYAEKMSDLLKPEGKLRGLLFNKEFEANTPPFGGTFYEYNSLFCKYFTTIDLKPCFDSIPPRLGNEFEINIFK
jgi:SAM-dependent methyltransferase